ncbi:MAG TPA: NUDIX domain-containing protein [Actinocrinis sp.]|jgi:8-oxo-dGTP pyrophosphatase MutT (NUDIX family)
MPIHLEKISSTVAAYLARHPDEAPTLEPLIEALGKGFDFTSRHRFPAHVTAGVVLLDAQQRVLQIHHRALGCWLNPGGHCEPGDKSLVGTALRELAEECGVGAEDIEPLDLGQFTTPDAESEILPLRIDVQQIPHIDARSEPAHRHFDFRYAYRVLAPVAVRLSHEAGAHRWHPVTETPDKLLAAHLT